MEGKEHYNDDDDKKRSDDDLNQNDDNDNFGLPDIDDSDQSDDFGYQPPKEEETSPYESGTESSEYSAFDDNDSNEYAGYEEENYGEEEETRTSEYQVHGLDDVDDNQTPVGLIVFLIIIVVALIGLGVWWFFFRADESQVAQRQTKPKIEQPSDTAKSEPVVEEPIIKDEPEPEPGHSGVLMLDSPTGRYYVVISSFVDDDLAMDYGKQLEKNGVATTILPPKQEKGFYRLAIADFVDLKDATLRAEEAKGQYGSEVWVIRY